MIIRPCDPFVFPFFINVAYTIRAANAFAVRSVPKQTADSGPGRSPGGPQQKILGLTT